MRGLTRRNLVVGLTGLSVGRFAFAQGKCDAKGMTVDEVLAAWQIDEFDKSSFLITIERRSRAAFVGKRSDGKVVSAAGVLGVLSVNGQPFADVLENEAMRVKAGSYKGVLRYVPSKHFVQGRLGSMDEAGDFLLEVAGVEGRKDLLIHTGTKPWHSDGCILAGAAKKAVVAGKTTVTFENDIALKRLHEKFYGADVPVACPNKIIRITFTDIS